MLTSTETGCRETISQSSSSSSLSELLTQLVYDMFTKRSYLWLLSSVYM